MWGGTRWTLKDFKNLQVWRKAHEVTLDVYRATQSFPQEERYGLTSQLRRAASSVGANIAEGCGRRSDGELTRFLQIARGSASELEYHLLLSRDLNLIAPASFQPLQRRVTEVQRMLTGLVQRVQPVQKVRSARDR